MTPAQRIVHWYDERFVRGPWRGTWWHGRGFIGMQVVNARMLRLTQLWVEERERSRGEGRRVMQQFCKLCDEYGVDVVTWAQPFDSGRPSDRPSTRQLEAFYGRLGFVRERRGSNRLWRRARPKAKAKASKWSRSWRRNPMDWRDLPGYGGVQ